MICELRVRQRLRSVAFCRPTDLVARALVVSSTQCSSRCFSALHPYSHTCKTTMTVRTCDSNPSASATPTHMQNRRIAPLTSSLSDRRSNHAGANAGERGSGECISGGGRGPWTAALGDASKRAPIPSTAAKRSDSFAGAAAFAAITNTAAGAAAIATVTSSAAVAAVAASPARSARTTVSASLASAATSPTRLRHARRRPAALPAGLRERCVACLSCDELQHGIAVYRLHRRTGRPWLYLLLVRPLVVAAPGAWRTAPASRP